MPSLAPENGAVLGSNGQEVEPEMLDSGAGGRKALIQRAVAESVLRYPFLRPGAENDFRLTDLTPSAGAKELPLNC